MFTDARTALLFNTNFLRCFKAEIESLFFKKLKSSQMAEIYCIPTLC